MMTAVHSELGSPPHQFQCHSTTAPQVSYELSVMSSVGQSLHDQCWDSQTNQTASDEAHVGGDGHARIAQDSESKLFRYKMLWKIGCFRKLPYKLSIPNLFINCFGKLNRCFNPSDVIPTGLNIR